MKSDNNSNYKSDHKFDKSSLCLYAVTDNRWLNGGSLAAQVEEAILGGATFVQLREKEMEHDDFIQEALEIKELCHHHNIPFVINDNVDIAIQADADGVHVGQSDTTASEARRLIGTNKILGVSAQNKEQAILAERGGADYIGVGAVFHTGSKSDADDVSMDTLREICQSVNIPVIAIGGISSNNVMELSGTGICGVAVISAIFAEKDIKKSTAKLRTLTEKMLA